MLCIGKNIEYVGSVLSEVSGLLGSWNNILPMDKGGLLYSQKYEVESNEWKKKKEQYKILCELNRKVGMHLFKKFNITVMIYDCRPFEPKVISILFSNYIMQINLEFQLEGKWWESVSCWGQWFFWVFPVLILWLLYWLDCMLYALLMLFYLIL